MHLLVSSSGVLDGAAEAIDLAQTPADVIVLSAADSELAALSRACRPGQHASLRLANYLQLKHPLAVDLYVANTLAKAKLVVLRLLGGAGYWSYGLDEIVAAARQHKIALVVLPGDKQPDPELMACSTLPAVVCEELRRYLAHGGPENAGLFLDYCQHIVAKTPKPGPAVPLAAAGLYRPATAPPAAAKGHAVILFYRAMLEGALTAPLDVLTEALAQRGVASTAIYVTSLKDAESLRMVQQFTQDTPPDVILNCTAFSASSGAADDPLAAYDCPVLQVVLASTAETVWAQSSQGLGTTDLAMNVVLPELDGRIHARAISFKADSHWDAQTQCAIVSYKPVADRIDYVAELTANWIALRNTHVAERRVAIILANYPIRDGRMANGVGYDTPASSLAILQALKTQGYAVSDLPASGNAVIEALQQGPTNARPQVASAQRLGLAQYQDFFATLPAAQQAEIIARWGMPEEDPFFHENAFHLSITRYGNVVVGLQPARGYHIDPQATYHDPALVPPHGYLAFYAWLRLEFAAHAIIHNGKHGSLEWLPGKANGLSSHCYPEIAFGAVPHFYPFIVNDPGEGTQAKRRASAVIIDHLTPPLTRAETYGPLKDLEALIDEYYLASGLDARRMAALRKDILRLTRSERLDVDAGFTGDDEADLTRLDAFLCDIKEAQIRDGLHVFGSSPTGPEERDLLVALARVPRRLGEAGDQSLIRALAADFGLGDFDPLDCNMAASWNGPRPQALLALSPTPWRSVGDTVERLELAALELSAKGPQSALVMAEIDQHMRPALQACGPQEMAALLKGLNGQRVAPGPSGAPTRGRLDVLPTGRNFYSLDSRNVPTPTAWNLGQKSAELLLLRHFQEHGQYPETIGLSAWGTANMRTGGDDIAQALALLGVKPVWEPASWRVTGYEIMPLARLGRPRVDVTLRISGFFRDAFPAQIELLDKAIRAVAALEEDAEDNPLAARVQREALELQAAGVAAAEAHDMAGFRIFGSRPGAYGAGLQAMIDETIWASKQDLAAAYITWGAYAYGARQQGVAAHSSFTRRLSAIQAVIHNQDNREHDVLDSDDYYQFEGGMAVAVQTASGQAPKIYHNDHSRPERPVVRTLEEEISRVMRSRVVNPKWLRGVKRHGYKGAFEMAATLDYMFAFAATTGMVKSHHFDLAYEAYIQDEATREFIKHNNPHALRDMAARFEEAIVRGLWNPRSNSAYPQLKELQHEQ